MSLGGDVRVHQPRRIGRAARRCSGGPGHGARGTRQEAAAPALGGGPDPPLRLLPGSLCRGREREEDAEARGADGECAGGAGSNHMAQTAQAARHLLFFLFLEPPLPFRPTAGPSRAPAPTRGEASSA